MPADSDAKMEKFHVKTLHVLIMFGLLAANVINGSPLQKKLKKGKMSNCSRFKTEIILKNYVADWNNSNHKA